MGITYKIRKAKRFVDTLDENGRIALLRRCREVQAAQAQLNRACADAFSDCMARCQGKCCKNIHADEIITLLDWLFILALNGNLYQEALACGAGETFFSADCPFLKGGIGPCLFADDQKPERCIITFCRPVPSVNGPVRRVRSAFSRLWRHTFFHRPLFWMGW
jgi:hypothetical protein